MQMRNVLGRVKTCRVLHWPRTTTPSLPETGHSTPPPPTSVSRRRAAAAPLVADLSDAETSASLLEGLPAGSTLRLLPSFPTARSSRKVSWLFSGQQQQTAAEVSEGGYDGLDSRRLFTSAKLQTLSAAEIQARARSSKMLNWVQIITTPTADTAGSCLFVHFDNKRYVFGSVAEGLQRAMVQRKLSTNRTEDIFVSGRINWHNTGGLFGLILSLADVLAQQKEGVKQTNQGRKEKGKNPLPAKAVIDGLSLHGGRNLTQLLATARRFIFRQGLPITPHEVREDPRPSAASKASSDPDWQDINIKVWYMPVESDEMAETKPPRKRSHDEMSASTERDVESAEDEGLRLVENVVRAMFDSNWSMDALVETTLHEAKLPAKLFVRDAHGRIQPYVGPLPGGAVAVPNIPVLVREPWPGAIITSLPPTEPVHQSMCYIVKSHDRRGKFLPDKAKSFGVPVKSWAPLTRGQNAIGADGQTVTPEMVLAEDVAGLGFAVLDVPDGSYLNPLIRRREWSTPEIVKGIEIFFWILGPSVVEDKRLQEFMKTMPAVRHIVCSGDSAPNMVALESSAAQVYRLHCLDAARFPLPQFSNHVSLTGKAATSESERYEVGRTGKMIKFAPCFEHLDAMIVPFPDLRDISSDLLVHEAQELAEEAKKKISDADFLAKIDKAERDIPNRDAEIITLGTGSSLPSKHRNVSATLVRVPGYGNYLFDAGENTMGQLRRVFGQALPEVLRELKAVYISHLHADHHLGTAGVIKAWNQETAKSDPAAKLLLVSHTHMRDWLREYADIEDYGYGRLAFVQFGRAPMGAKIYPSRCFGAEETAAYGLQQIDACLVNHCHGALATVFTWPTGLKIAYSGDCRPSDDFVEIGKGTTVLIHESTFEDDRVGDAIAKKHSTMSEAIDVGRRMGARRIMLTHFSQRYQKVPIFDIDSIPDAEDADKAKLDQVVLVAFDYMRVKIGDFRKAQAFLPAIQKLFEAAADDG